MWIQNMVTPIKNIGQKYGNYKCNVTLIVTYLFTEYRLCKLRPIMHIAHVFEHL